MSADLKSFISILQMIGVIATIISLAVLSYRVMKYGDNVDKRTLLMDGIGRIFIGVMIIGLLTTVSGFIIKYINDLYSHAGVDGIKSAELTIKGAQVKDDSSFLSRIICWIIDKITSFISPDGVGKDFFGLKPLNELIAPKDYNIFSKDQWNILMYVYRVTMSISFIAVIVMVFKTGIDFLRSSTNPNAYEEAKEDIYRWFFVALIIAAGPIITKGIIVVGGWLTQLLNETFKNSGSLNLTGNIFKDITTGSDITTAIVKLYFAYLQFKINIIFIIRTWVLAAFIVFTPIAVSLWGINKNVNALPVWLGELITNAFMGFFYALVFTIYTAFLTLNHSVLFVLVGLTMVIKLADVLRNSLQGFFTRLSGLDESRMANRFGLGTMLGTAMGAYGMAKKGVSGISNAIKGSKGEGSNKDLFSGAGDIVDKTINRNSKGANGMNEGLNIGKSRGSQGSSNNPNSPGGRFGGVGNNEALNLNKEGQVNNTSNKNSSDDPVTKDGIGNNEGLGINLNNKDKNFSNGATPGQPVTKDGIGNNEGLGINSNKENKNNALNNETLQGEPVTKDGIGNNEGVDMGSGEFGSNDVTPIDTQTITSDGAGNNEGIDMGSSEFDSDDLTPIDAQTTSSGSGSNEGISRKENPYEGLKDVQDVRADFFNRLSQKKGFGNKNSNAIFRSIGTAKNRQVVNSLGKDMRNELKEDFIRKNESNPSYVNNKTKLEGDANSYAKSTFDKAVYGSKSSPLNKFTGNSRMAKGDFSDIKKEIEQNDRNEQVNEFLKRDK
ncbi:hypothetical protein [Clostridium baratii]|uniref:hypothetical protein n=1 Tax=Clostridium baratii TaxID=1561 RepID=UPI0005F2E2F2|nr:hypothetical protein [Clostridium baratii]KJU70946.1 hypothetical protein UC77_12300 [Clostridium baratii]